MMGPPGAGKGTQAENLADKLDLPHISTGDIFRDALKKNTEMGQKAKEFIEEGELVPDNIVVGIVEERLSKNDCEDGFILDGFPRTIKQAEGLDNIIAPGELTAVLNLEVRDEVLVERLTKRRVCAECGATFHLLFDPPEDEKQCDKCNGNLIQREDDQPETVKNRLEVYSRETAPLISYYQKKDLLKSINGEQAINEVFEETLAKLKGDAHD